MTNDAKTPATCPDCGREAPDIDADHDSPPTGVDGKCHAEYGYEIDGEELMYALECLRIALALRTRERDEARERLRWYEAAHMLLANDDAFIFRDSDSSFFMSAVVGEGLRQPALALNMNDTFFWGCADAEPFGYIDAPALLEIVKRDGSDGLVKWALDKRKQRSESFDAAHVARYSPGVALLDQRDAALAAQAKAEAEREEARGELADIEEAVFAAGKTLADAGYLGTQSPIDGLHHLVEERDELRALVERLTKYAIEDGAITHGFTRLARVVNEGRAWLDAHPKEKP